MIKQIFIHAFCLTLLFVYTFVYPSKTFSDEGKAISLPPDLSEQTQVCIICHKNYTPGIVEDWLRSRHSKTTPEIALKKSALERRVSSETIPESLQTVVVGCYECHSQNPSAHKDNFEHFGFKINVIVSPNDCKICHSAEVDQYSVSKKAYALDNLQKNPQYHSLVEAIVSTKEIQDDKIIHLNASDSAKAESCYACHGTRITVLGMKKISSGMGDIYVPDLTNWPNQGVGRINPDESRGSCTSCHPRHSFSIEIARKPYTCSQCHIEPDVPAFNIYHESKHGNIFSSNQHEWNWNNVPWRVGKDFQTPTCATCHNSLIATPDSKVIVPRTHDFGARLWVRIFGLIYSHPQPKDGRTYSIKNKEGQSFPTSLTGELASEYLIDENEQMRRQTEMKKVCLGCHNTDWASKHFARLDDTIVETDKMVSSATQLLLKAWKEGLADASNPFDEEIEHLWIRQWLFYANSVRYASAMEGPDYAAFKNGWWELTTTLNKIRDLIQTKRNNRNEK
ncbi:MAG: multiheme c-type cytochrome [Candidatus Jettenia sp. CY-1]|nr:MAG: multiheme c-type cytochrome [Candidatus Jettenia sp. CY-1]